MAVTVSCSTAMPFSTIFPSTRFYEMIGEEPNYHIFFNKTLKQLNKKSRTLSGTRLHIKSAIYDKANCYSEVEDLITVIRTKDFRPAYASSVLRSNLMGVCMTGRRTDPNKEIGQYLTCRDELASGEGRMVGYRCEYRVRYEQVFTLMNDLSAVLRQCAWYEYPSARFFKLIGHNLAWLTNEMSVQSTGLPGLSDVYRAALIEVLLVECFFKGRLSRSVAPKNFAEFMKARYSESAVLTNVQFEPSDIEAFVSRENVVDTIGKLVRYDIGMSAELKLSFASIIQLYEAEQDEAAEILLSIYCSHCSSVLGEQISSRSLRNAVLQPLTATSCKLEQSYMDMALLRVFTWPASCNESLPYKLAYLVIRRELNNEAALCGALKSKLLAGHCDFLVDWDAHTPVALFVVNCSGDTFDLRRLDTAARTQTVNRLRGSLNRSLRQQGAQGRRVKWSEEELIRLVAARDFHVRIKGKIHGFWAMAASCYIYGFPMLRSMGQMKDAMRRLQLKPVDYMRLCSLASVWRPIHFTLANRREEYALFEIVLSQEDETILTEILSYEENALAEELVLHDRDTVREEYVNTPLPEAGTAEPVMISTTLPSSQSVPLDHLTQLMQRQNAPLEAAVRELKESINLLASYIRRHEAVPTSPVITPTMAVVPNIEVATMPDEYEQIGSLMEESPTFNEEIPSIAVQDPEIDGAAPYSTPISLVPVSQASSDAHHHFSTVPPTNDTVEVVLNMPARQLHEAFGKHLFTISGSQRKLFGKASYPSASDWRQTIECMVHAGDIFQHNIGGRALTGYITAYYSAEADLQKAIASYQVEPAIKTLSTLSTGFTETAAKKLLLRLASAPDACLWTLWWQSMLDREIIVALPRQARPTRGITALYALSQISASQLAK